MPRQLGKGQDFSAQGRAATSHVTDPGVSAAPCPPRVRAGTYEEAGDGAQWEALGSVPPTIK